MAAGVGTVLQFDETRGFGFIEADDGGEDVFVHASVLGSDERALVRGARVSFEAVRGNRGRRATTVHMVSQAAHQTAARAAAQPAAASAPSQPAAMPEAAAAVLDSEADVCDLLSSAELGRELTDILLDVGADLTAAQIIAIRTRLLASAAVHGWVED